MRLIGILITVYSFLLINNVCGADINGTELIGDGFKIYYNPITGIPLPGKPVFNERRSVQKIVFGNLPCLCEAFACSCCAGVNITLLNFDRKACATFTYKPMEFAVMMDVTMNDENFYSNSISAKNPPPMCLRLPTFPAISFCVRLYNIFTPGKNIHACIDFETRVFQSPILVLHFDCLRLGADGIAWLKPEDNGGLPRSEMYLPSPPLLYDDVNFKSDDITHILRVNTTTLSPVKRDMIGQLKL